MPLTVDDCEVAYCLLSRIYIKHGKENVDFAVKCQGQTFNHTFIDFPSTIHLNENVNRKLNYRQCSLDTKQSTHGLLKVKLLEFLSYFALSPKPVLLIGYFQYPFFPRLQEAIRKTNMVDMFYGIIAGFADPLPIIMEKFPSRTEMEKRRLPPVVREFLTQHESEEMSDVRVKLNTLEKIVNEFGLMSDLIKSSMSYAESITRGLDARKIADIDQTFQNSIKFGIIAILKKMERSLLPYVQLKKVYDQKGSDGIERLLLSRERSNGEQFMSESDRLNLRKLRKLESREQQYYEKKPFSNRKNKRNIVEEEFLLNQVPISQITPSQIQKDQSSRGEFPFGRSSFSENLVDNVPINQSRTTENISDQFLVKYPSVSINFDEKVPGNQLPNYPVAGNQLPVANRPFYEDNADNVPVDQFPNYETAGNQRSVENRPFNESFIDNVPDNQYPTIGEVMQQIFLKYPSLPVNSDDNVPVDQFPNYDVTGNQFRVANPPSYESYADYVSVDQFPNYEAAGYQHSVENRPFYENYDYNVPIFQSPNFPVPGNQLRFENRPFYENYADNVSRHQMPHAQEGIHQLQIGHPSSSENFIDEVSLHQGLINKH